MIFVKLLEYLQKELFSVIHSAIWNKVAYFKVETR